MKGVQDFDLRIKATEFHGQSLALIVAYVPYSLDSGLEMQRIHVFFRITPRNFVFISDFVIYKGLLKILGRSRCWSFKTQHYTSASLINKRPPH